MCCRSSTFSIPSSGGRRRVPTPGERPVWSGKPPHPRPSIISMRRPWSYAGPTSITWKKPKMKLSDSTIWTPEERAIIEQDTMLARHRLEEQYANLEQQHETAALGMWVFLATEVMFFGALFVGLGAYRFAYPQPFERASEKLNWIIGGTNTVVLRVSRLMMALAVHAAKLGPSRRLVW